MAPDEPIVDRCATIRCLYDDLDRFIVARRRFWVLHDGAKASLDHCHRRESNILPFWMVFLAGYRSWCPEFLNWIHHLNY